MIQQTMTTSCKQQLLEGIHNFTLAGNVFKIALYTSSATLDASTAEYTTDNEVVASGYTAGGAILTNIAPASANSTGYVSFENVTWAGPSGIVARGALIYNSNASGYTNPSVMVIDFGLDRYDMGSGFTVTFPTADAANAIIRLA